MLPCDITDHDLIIALVTAAISRAGAQGRLSATPKSAFAMMVRQLAAKKAHHGIRADAVGSTVIDCGLVIPMMQTPTAELLKRAVGAMPLERLGRENEVAGAIAFLASRWQPI